jgi:hypothetical protein
MGSGIVTSGNAGEVARSGSAGRVPWLWYRLDDEPALTECLTDGRGGYGASSACQLMMSLSSTHHNTNNAMCACTHPPAALCSRNPSVGHLLWRLS